MQQTESATAPMKSSEAKAGKRPSVAPLVIALAIAAIGVGVIATSTAGGSGMYNYALADLVERSDELAGKELKVSGRIKVGSVRGEAASESFRFDLEDDQGHSIPVGYKRLLPDPFEEGREAIVQGKIVDGTLMASNLTVKCPSRYADTEDLSEAEKARYYQTDYRKHAELGAKSSKLPAPAQGAAPAPAN
jgi:cytochrome c-type biogenesis protein CcmE